MSDWNKINPLYILDVLPREKVSDFSKINPPYSIFYHGKMCLILLNQLTLLDGYLTKIWAFMIEWDVWLDWYSKSISFYIIVFYTSVNIWFVIFTGICQAILFWQHFYDCFFLIGKMEKGCLKKLKQTNW